jgi:hypothetical protein
MDAPRGTGFNQEPPSQPFGGWARGGLVTALVVTFALDLAAPLAAQIQPPRPRATGAAAKPSSGAVKTYPKCRQDHAGRSYRVQRLAKDGDAKVLTSIAGHVVIYAKERYSIQDIVSATDYQRAQKEMYDFLSWKLGNPSLVTAQWVSAGYQHFDSHADEAAAALLGMELPGPGAQAFLPKELTAWIKAQVDSAGGEFCPALATAMMQTTGVAPESAPADAGALPPGSQDGNAFVGAACDRLVPLATEAIKKMYDRIGISQAALLGNNKYDVKDHEIELMVYLKRNPKAWTAVPKVRPGA